MNLCRHYLAFLPFSLIFCVVSPVVGGAALASGGTFLGPWATVGNSSVVEIKACDRDPSLFCGKIVWLWEETEADGTPVLDVKNPDPQMRQEPLMGRQILSKMVPNGAQTEANGQIYNPEDGRTYRSTLKLIDQDTLHVDGCVMFICRTQVWRRPSSLPRFDDNRV